MENFVANSKNVYGYARVSTKEQNEARQLEAFKEFGVPEDNIFIDKRSGKDFEREEYQLLKKILKRTENNVLVIKSIDRLGRNYKEIQNEWREITQDLKTDIVVLDMPILDTRQYKDLLGNFISDLVLQVLSFVAEEERTKIRSRQKEGIDIALKNGVKFGRPKIEIPKDFEEQYKIWKEGRTNCKGNNGKAWIKKREFLRNCKKI